MSKHRRRSPRKTAHVAINVTNAMTGEPMGRIGNLSADGMLLVCNRKVADNALFQLSFELVDADGVPRMIEVGVHEQWSEPANMPGHFWVGFQFIDVAPEDVATISSWLGDNNE
ncbi:PilZ domain-containing protein [Dokdonella sp.]|uniref:PilZ domain-containing protein n=1 Tax=Dokdonella sp. TaxID=2291710 RepID=UPI0025BF2463|nr:PilZ domain-containing protein [Dokdonella sp.]MBX3690760.1 PilZ domain-containing protein [Dokdonella sp.]MCW5568529.1 PilZ domain-containing protein [Dokdonella sp.]